MAARVNEILPLYASVHRGAGYASLVCTAAYESARAEIAAFIGAGRADVVIFTRNTTDALNLLASAAPGPVVYLDVEHHANLLPWQARGGRVLTAQPTLAATLSAIDGELVRRLPPCSPSRERPTSPANSCRCRFSRPWRTGTGPGWP